MDLIDDTSPVAAGSESGINLTFNARHQALALAAIGTRALEGVDRSEPALTREARTMIVRMALESFDAAADALRC